MRRLQTLLLAAGLAAVASSTAVAGPPEVETYEWSQMYSSKGRLGIMVMSLTPELRKHYGALDDRGVLVARVEPGSAAATAGLAVGDVLVEVRGKPVDEASDVIQTLGGLKKGDAVPITVLRDRKRLTLTAKMTEDAGRGPAWDASPTFHQPLPELDKLWDLFRNWRPSDAPGPQPDRTTKT